MHNWILRRIIQGTGLWYFWIFFQGGNVTPVNHEFEPVIVNDEIPFPIKYLFNTEGIYLCQLLKKKTGVNLFRNSQMQFVSMLTRYTPFISFNSFNDWCNVPFNSWSHLRLHDTPNWPLQFLEDLKYHKKLLSSWTVNKSYGKKICRIK